MKRSVLVRISNRKFSRKYHDVVIDFNDVYDFVEKADNESLRYGKNANVFIVDPDVFTDDELDYLSAQYFEF